MRKNLAAFVTVAALIAGATSAGASFEGEPGKIVFSGRGDKTGLFLARRDGSHVFRLTRTQDGSPQWSPQGDRIAFLRWTADSYSSLQVIGRDGAGRVRLSPAPEAGCGVQFPHWSYDGLFIAYAHDCFDREPRVAELRVVTPDGGSHIAVTDQESLNHMGPQPWSPSLEESSQLTFSSDRDGDHDVYVMNSDGTEVRQLTNEDGFAIAPVWSPDGSAIAYTVQDAARPRSAIWTVPPSGGEAMLLVEGAPHATDPIWSPDGSRLAFARRTRSGVATLVVVGADGSNEVIVAEGQDPHRMSWSPTSQALLITERGNLVRYRLGSTVRRKILVRNVSRYSTSDWQAR